MDRTGDLMPRTFPDATHVELGYYEMSAHLLALEIIRRGYEVTWLNRAYFVTEIEGTTLGFWSTRSNLVSHLAAKSATRKDITSRLLAAQGIPVGEFRTVRASDRLRAGRAARRVGYPLVVKPLTGAKGRGVTVGVRSAQALRSALDKAIAAGASKVIIERYFTGEEARFLLVGDKCVSVVGKVAPQVVGDGRSTIQSLIEQKNRSRRQNPHLARRPIILHPDRLERLQVAGIRPESVPVAGQRVEFDDKASFSDGADSVDLTDEVHPTYRETVARIGKAIPGLGLAGVDLLASDLRSPATPDNHVVLEVNSMPALGAHHFPGSGEPRDVARLIIDRSLAEVRGES